MSWAFFSQPSENVSTPVINSTILTDSTDDVSHELCLGLSKVLRASWKLNDPSNRTFIRGCCYCIVFVFTNTNRFFAYTERGFVCGSVQFGIMKEYLVPMFVGLSVYQPQLLRVAIERNVLGCICVWNTGLSNYTCTNRCRVIPP